MNIGGMHVIPRPTYALSRTLDPPGTMRTWLATLIAFTGYVSLSKNGCRTRSTDMSTSLPMRNPSRIPFFTHAFVRQPVFDAASGSAARTSPRFSAALNASNRRRCSSVYCAGGESNSCSISDGSIGFLDQPERLEDSLDPSHGAGARRHHGKPPDRLQQSHLRHRRLHGDRIGFHEVDFHQRKIPRVNLSRG